MFNKFLNDTKGQGILVAGIMVICVFIGVLILAWVFVGTGILGIMSQELYTITPTSSSVGDLSRYHENMTSNIYIAILILLFGYPLSRLLWYSMRRDPNERIIEYDNRVRR